MKSLAKKLTALLLITMMLLSTLVTIANAKDTDTQSTSTSTSDTPLLTMADIFEATPSTNKTNATATPVDVDEDENSDYLKISGENPNNYVQYDTGVTLDPNGKYEIKITATKSIKGNQPVFFYIDKDLKYGFKWSNGGVAERTGDSGSNWTLWSQVPITDHLVKPVTTTIGGENIAWTVSLKIIVDGPHNIMTAMVLCTDGLYRAVTNDVINFYAEEDLCLTFGKANNDGNVYFSNLEVSRWDNAAETYLDMSDIVKAEAANITADKCNYTYIDDDGDGINETLHFTETENGASVKYNFKNIALTSDSKYVINFKFGMNASSMGYLTIDPEQKYGFRFSNGGANYHKGTGNQLYWQDPIINSFPNDNGYFRSFKRTTISNIGYGINAKIIVDGPNNIMTFMVMNIKGIFKTVVTREFDPETDTNLCLTFGDAVTNGNSTTGFFADVKVSAFDTVTVVNGDSTSSVDLLPTTTDSEDVAMGTAGTRTTTETYTLTSAKKTGYVLNGWKVNGGETVYPVGTAVDNAGLETIEAVYTEIMSKYWYQFKDNEDGTKDIRIVSIIDSIDYEGIGFEVTQKCNDQIKTDTLPLTTVYGAVSDKYGEAVTLKTLGYDENGGYLTAFVIRNVKANVGNVTIELTPYQYGVDATEPTVGAMTTLVFDVANKTIVTE